MHIAAFAALIGAAERIAVEHEAEACAALNPIDRAECDAAAARWRKLCADASASLAALKES